MFNLPAFILLVSLSIIQASFNKAFAYEELVVAASTEIDIDIDRFPAKGEYLAVWLAPEYGFKEQHRHLANLLALAGIEIWQSNIIESLFLTQNVRSLRQLDGEYIADVMQYAHKITAKKIILIGDSYAAINVLTGAHKWQQRQTTSDYLIGAVLFSPYTYASLPQLGTPPDFMPVVSATNIPIMIYQARNSGNINQFENLISRLQQHDAPVYTKFMPDIFSLFYHNPPTKHMLKLMDSLPGNILKMIHILERHAFPEKAINFTNKVTEKSGKDIFLKKYSGKITPVPIELQDISGTRFIKHNYKNQVTIVNFWATWCPPCVEEIPSLNRLTKKMQDTAFQLISVNYAEDINTVIDFMRQVNVEYPVLIDNNGHFAKQWNVVSYPSTFVIDRNGKIQYGVNAAIEWDSPGVINKLKALQNLK